MSFVYIAQIHLHLPDNGSLKGKRKELNGLKAQLQRRFGAAVAETDHHDLWQRATLTAALVACEHARLTRAADELERFVDSRFPDTARVEGAVMSSDELI